MDKEHKNYNALFQYYEYFYSEFVKQYKLDDGQLNDLKYLESKINDILRIESDQSRYRKKDNSSDYQSIIQSIIFSVEEKILINRLVFLNQKQDIHNTFEDFEEKCRLLMVIFLYAPSH